MLDNIILFILFAIVIIVGAYFIFKKKDKDDNDKPVVPPTPNAKWKDDSVVLIDTGATSFEKEISITGDTFVTIDIEGDKDAIKIEPESGQNLNKVKITINENNADDARNFKLTINNK